ncbi:MAG: hypothetical protein ACRC1H_13715, partial [Caldilineaceae bacterium]
SLPPGFHLDESFEGLEAWRMVADPAYRPIFLEGNFGVPPLNAWANAISFALGGLFGIAPGPTLMRTTAAVVGTLGVAAVAWLAYELAQCERDGGSRRLRLTAAFPLLAAAALAVMRWHVHFSRMGIEPVFMPLWWALGMALLLHALRTGRWVAYAALGVTLAAPMYTYQGAWHFPFLIGGSALVLLSTQRKGDLPPKQRRVAGLLLAGGLALLLVTPLLLFLWRNPELAILRPAQISVVGETASPADSNLLTTTVQTLAMFWPFGQTGDLDPRRNLPGAPALPLLLAIPFFAGVGVALWHWRRPVGWISLTGLLGLLLVGFISEYAPHFHRILGAAAPVALLIGLGLDAGVRGVASLLAKAGVAQRSRVAVAWTLAVALLLGAGIVGARDYFVRWAALPDLYHAFDEGLWQVGQWLAEQPAEMPLYLTPRSADHPTLAFALATGTGDPRTVEPPVTFDGRAVLPLTDGPAPAPERYLAIEHEDFRTPLLLPEVLPDAAEVERWRDRSGAAYATAWERPAGSDPLRAPQVTLDVPVGDGIRLLGYDVLPDSLHPGAVLYLQLHWLVEQAPTADWTTFTHLLNPVSSEAPPMAGKDALPGGGSLPTSRWQTGWRILDEYQILLPADLAPGVYDLAAGLYQADGSRLPADEPIRLGAVTIAAP